MSRISESQREAVRQRAAGRCEYCRKPDLVSTYGYHVDPVIPLAHGGSSELPNLAWACFECNVGKGRDVASYDQVTQKLTPLYPPRTGAWDDHFVLRGARLVGITATGRVTVNLLALNAPDQLETRQLLREIERGLRQLTDAAYSHSHSTLRSNRSCLSKASPRKAKTF
ncbi:MAG TPA: HNH endonuclease signature motif containing protein, partial [Aggregatilineaceae bacterium]|nr:HNH endonuclease signature motif containing protein [Aggregatilineaceae bacterium]